MKNNWVRLIAGALVSVVLVGAISLTGGMKKGHRTDGLLYEASGLHPDAELLLIDGQTVTAEEYLYWLAYDCEYLSTLAFYFFLRRIIGVKSNENTNQIFLYLNRGLQDYINSVLISGEYPSDIKKEMEAICYNIIHERNIELKSNIVTLINNRVQQYIKLYQLKVNYAR